MPFRLSTFIITSALCVQGFRTYRVSRSQYLKDNLHLRREAKKKSTKGGTSCAALKNIGSFSTVELEVGTPPQKLDVVADTGSDSIVLRSCACMKSGKCGTTGKCFTGTNASSSFSLHQYDNGTFESVLLMYGSGNISAVVASEVISVGNVTASMDEGVMLIVEQKLDFDTPLEGILGLGLPIKRGGILATNEVEVKPFLDVAGINQFSVCFSPTSGQDGVIRMGELPMHKPLGTVGHSHWGLDFRGISIGSTTVAVQETDICSLAGMKEGQATPCGAIPDSGTTLILGPEDHITALYTQLCDAWPRCAAAAANTTQNRSDVFQKELYSCEGLDSLPHITFHVAGADGTLQALDLDPNSYVFETMVDDVRHLTDYILGIFPHEHDVKVGVKTVCIPAFGKDSMSYKNSANGPVWIFGTPFFYHFQVAYDRASDPPAVAFNPGPCEACGPEPEAASLAQASSKGGHRFLRFFEKPRMPRVVDASGL